MFSIRFPKASHDFGINPLAQIKIIWTKCSLRNALSPLKNCTRENAFSPARPPCSSNHHLITTRSQGLQGSYQTSKSLNSTTNSRNHQGCGERWTHGAWEMLQQELWPWIFIPRSQSSAGLGLHSTRLHPLLAAISPAQARWLCCLATTLQQRQEPRWSQASDISCSPAIMGQALSRANKSTFSDLEFRGWGAL